MHFDELRNRVVGIVEFVSPVEIKVLLELNAPQTTALNTGIPHFFPRINNFVLIPNEEGFLVGLISWIGTEYSNYPKRKGFKDFDIIDLPYPVRKLSLSPLGTLRKEGKLFRLERGIVTFPSVGDNVIIPSDIQLQSILENQDKKATVEIGSASIVSNVPVKIDPDRLYGRHFAVLGNTGSGKSCSVAGIIRWTIESAKKAINNTKGSAVTDPNARFIILDPNGEYSNAFSDIGKVRRFQISFTEDDLVSPLKVPAWLWNSYEWSAITQASGKTQRPILRRALREIRNSKSDFSDDVSLQIQRFYSSAFISIRNLIRNSGYRDDASKAAATLKSIEADSNSYQALDSICKKEIKELQNTIDTILSEKFSSFVKDGKTIEYYKSFTEEKFKTVANSIEKILEKVGGLGVYTGPNEDSPVPFDESQLPDHVDRLAKESGHQEWLDFYIMRMRTMLSEKRIASILKYDSNVSLESWLADYLGADDAINGPIAIIDLSIVPIEIVHIVVSVISRIIFEALQRYRRMNSKVLPTVLVMEEAHTFIKKYSDSQEDFSSERLSCQIFEKIAREGRKFGLGLLLSSQRPSELSSTVLSQCNTFLLHRIVNDRDQELVRRLVPDNLGSLLEELPVLPTRKAILLGHASSIPILVDIKDLPESQRPDSKDPDFWDVWTKKSPRKIDWPTLASKWQFEDLVGEIDITNLRGASAKKSKMIAKESNPQASKKKA
ncbi:ATP-binding protein [Leptospira yanagawae]|uniref:ATP-binding protein n=1 Tax=Leptospira yanagawae TaxID=293069 RepID=A0ABY2M526_9LEPT|nr:ATP-binding protein [Leptospira yanagawae]TGL23017.1 ATP-binding protein [Leptospira yanagawae]